MCYLLNVALACLATSANVVTGRVATGLRGAPTKASAIARGSSSARSGAKNPISNTTGRATDTTSDHASMYKQYNLSHVTDTVASCDKITVSDDYIFLNFADRTRIDTINARTGSSWQSIYFTGPGQFGTGK